MLENCKSAKERWGGVGDLVERWLNERKEVLVRYCALTDPDGARDRELRGLCEVLVDYVSAGHFEVYDQLLREARDFNDQAAVGRARELYRQVESTTDAVLDFNDKYQETDDLDGLTDDLSRIGELLETRFEAEDGMIAILHTAHRDRAT